MQASEEEEEEEEEEAEKSFSKEGRQKEERGICSAENRKRLFFFSIPSRPDSRNCDCMHGDSSFWASESLMDSILGCCYYF